MEKEPTDYIMVTNWDKVDADDFYLSNDWLEELGSKKRQRELKRMAAEGKLFEAFVVPAVTYAIYREMDAHQVFIDEDGNEVLSCESEIIGNNHKERWEYDS